MNSYFNFVIAQNPLPIKFDCEYTTKNDSNNVKMVVENISKKTFYYSIVLQEKSDTGWVPLLSDINSLGQNEFTVLKPLNAGRKAIKNVSVKTIRRQFENYKNNKIRFGVMYYEKQDFESKGDIIYLCPI